MKKDIVYLTSDEALDLCKDQGNAIKLGTLQMWYHKYHLGKKVAGRLKFNKEKLLSILEGVESNGKSKKKKKGN